MKLHIENSIIIETNGKTATLGCGKYEFDSASEFIEFIESLGDEPKQPLIKDENIRKAVRAWAEALGQREQFLCIKNGTRLEVSDGSPHLLYISFWADKPTLDSIDDRTYYTIAELCGEEEE